MTKQEKEERIEYLKVLKDKWQQKAEKVLLGKKIVKVEWMTDKECEDAGSYSKPICMLLDDGTWIYPSKDDEGNDGGALFTTSKLESCLPVFSIGD